VQVPKDPELLSGAASIGASLKVDTTAQRLADVACLGLGGIAVVSLVEEIGDGREPPGRQGTGDLVLRRTAVSQGGKGSPDGDLRIGESLPPLRGREITDEGGRGLFIAARLVTRWGVRYGTAGKTIWTEQRLNPAA
jgi:hypothetical protein